MLEARAIWWEGEGEVVKHTDELQVELTNANCTVPQ